MVIYINIYIYISPLYHKFITIISLIHHHYITIVGFDSSPFLFVRISHQPTELLSLRNRTCTISQVGSTLLGSVQKSCYSTRYHKYTYLKIYA